MELKRPNLPCCPNCQHLEPPSGGLCPECGFQIPQVSDLELACLWAKTATWMIHGGVCTLMDAEEARQLWEDLTGTELVLEFDNGDVPF